MRWRLRLSTFSFFSPLSLCCHPSLLLDLSRSLPSHLPASPCFPFLGFGVIAHVNYTIPISDRCRLQWSPFFPVNFLLLRGQLFSRYSTARCFDFLSHLVFFSSPPYGRYSLTLPLPDDASVTLHQCSLMQKEGCAVRSVKLP